MCREINDYLFIYSKVERENSVPELNWCADQRDVSADQQAPDRDKN
jgi:hypothetical protein